jgi:uncharacterized protein YjbI with pentapeptide repeats
MPWPPNRSGGLRGAEFIGANLRGARFAEADLSGVVMRGVNAVVRETVTLAGRNGRGSPGRACGCALPPVTRKAAWD